MYYGRISCCLVLLFAFLYSSAQAPSKYSFQQDDSLLKKGYYQETLRKKETLFAGFGKEYATDYKKIYEEQFREIGGFWKSSRVVTDPAVHGYLQELVRKIISRNPELSGLDARVVFSRDWWPNAYSMGDGTIAINAGLMIFLNNEAQLAFVISHELAHYYLDHSGKAITKYVETVNSQAFQAELRRLSKTEYRANKQLELLSQDFLFSNRRHMRSHESEADRLAFSFLKRTDFDCDGIRTCLQLLDTIDKSSLFEPLMLEQLFNADAYPFKKKWIRKESAIFSELGNNEASTSAKEADSLKTHPDCEERIGMLKDSLAGRRGGSLFLVDQAKFASLKKDFVPEMTEQCFRDNRLSRYLYYSLLLLQSPDYKDMAIYGVTRCLNLLYDKQKDHELGLAVDSESETYSTEYNLLLRMLSRISLTELANVNYQFCVKYATEMKNYPGFIEEARKAQSRK